MVRPPGLLCSRVVPLHTPKTETQELACAASTSLMFHATVRLWDGGACLSQSPSWTSGSSRVGSACRPRGARHFASAGGPRAPCVSDAFAWRRFAGAFTLRQRMLNFVQNIQYYMMFEVLEPTWHVLEKSLRSVSLAWLVTTPGQRSGRRRWGTDPTAPPMAPPTPPEPC